MKCYNIENQNDYFMQLSDSVEIEDAGDCFITEAEMKEMGLSRTYYGFVLYTKKVKAAIKMWTKQIPPGGKSVVCDDDDLIEALKEYFSVFSEGIADILGQRGKFGFARSGNKFMVKATAKPKKKANGKKDLRKTDWFKLMNLAEVALGNHGMYCTLSKDVPDRLKTLTSLKRIIRWYDMVDANKTGWWNYDGRKKATKEDMQMVKRMWWKPELVVDIVKRKGK